MPGRVLRVSSPDIHGHLRLSVEIEEFAGNTRRTFRLSDKRYDALGAPAKGDALDDEMLAALAEAEGEIRALSKAESLLAYGDNSANGLCRKLRRRGYSQENAEAAVAHMMQKGYIREEEQVYRLVLVAANRKHWGPRRIVADLAHKGYSVALVKRVIEQAKDEGELDFQESARALLEKKFGDEQPSPLERRRVLYQYGY
ncbi:MAG: RecX family transcriptional regulator [Clostridia bacterium]|nr:RecX family transcriptional regulator [Clostridia bacterium]